MHFTCKNLPLGVFSSKRQESSGTMSLQRSDKEVTEMIKRFMQSRWWNLTAAITALATVGYVIYMAYAFRILMIWFLIASVFMTVYEFVRFASRRKIEVT